MRTSRPGGSSPISRHPILRLKGRHRCAAVSGPVQINRDVASATAVGRAMIKASVGSVTDSGYVSVVPAATVAMVWRRRTANFDLITELVTTNLDGSDWQVIAPVTGNTIGGLAWSRDGSQLFTALGSYDTRLHSVSMTGTVKPLIENPTSLRSESFPQVSADGQWIYFNGRPDHQNGALWRVRTNGTGAAQIGPATDWYGVDAFASPSPDGTRLAYLTNREGSTPRLRILNLATGSITSLVDAGMHRWSPGTDEIAYMPAERYSDYLSSDRVSGNNTFSVIRADGTGVRRIPTGTRRYTGWFDWSPDGKYLLARPASGSSLPVELVDVQTGAIIPIPFTASDGWNAGADWLVFKP
jgi:Tol biopolymer transport system component